MAGASASHSATVMPDGKVIIAGGAGGTVSVPVPHARVQEFTPATNAWRTLSSLQAARAGHAAAVTPDGLLVLLGGNTTTASLKTIEVHHH